MGEKYWRPLIESYSPCLGGLQPDKLNEFSQCQVKKYSFQVLGTHLFFPSIFLVNLKVKLIPTMSGAMLPLVHPNGAWGLNLFLVPSVPVLVTLILFQFPLIYRQFNILQFEIISYVPCAVIAFWSFLDFLLEPIYCRPLVFLLIIRILFCPFHYLY